jgi:uncharacterized membrane protein YraQ (UPF0718 family)
MIRRIVQKLGAVWIFIIAVAVLYLVILFINPLTALAGLRTFLSLFKKILPSLGVVFFLLIVSNLIVENKKLLRFLGNKTRKAGWLIAVFTGIVSAGPIYLWYPLLSDLKEKGMREGLNATFLYNRAVKIPLLPMMVFYFGIKFVLVLTVYMVLFSVLNGYIVEKLVRLKGERI